ncbi:ATP-binding protein [Streptomyces sp. NBC_01171]|uniref:ATP-binding protein n=1 Tax=Streptomyces sp. NBC_01171 TaxID=2903757 RepID=UPI003865263E|nr:tetratricopeptide repeat protein [Streptomyces sp. NBC_01171]
MQVGDGNTQHNTTHLSVEHAGQLVYQAAPGAVSVPVVAALPRDVAAFTGRDRELERLTRVPDKDAGLVIRTVDGMPGAGKTALVTHAAHLLAPHFPDGQMFLRLHAHTPGQAPLDPSEALAALLTGRGIPQQALPLNLDERAAMWRAHTVSKRILLVLDDASGAPQINPLLPAEPGCLILVTSRRRLIAVDGADPMPLDVLPPDQAVLLFARLARRTLTPGDHAPVERAVALCGHLPLAIALLAGSLAHHPTWSIAEFTEEFAATQDRLGELEADDRAVAAAFDLSYHDLPPHRQRLFRRLGLHPGDDIDAYATAALDGIPLAEARKDLRALYTDHLIDEPTPGRYRLHDLIRTYARIRVQDEPASERQQAEQRLLDYYQHTSLHADSLISAYTRPHTSALTTRAPQAAPDLHTQKDGIAWLRTERPNLLAAIDHTSRTHQSTRTIALTTGITSLLRQDGPWNQAVTLHHSAAMTAHQDLRPLDQANALHDQGIVHRRANEYSEAIGAQKDALALYREVGSELGEANVLRDLGVLLRLRGDYEGATAYVEQALEVHRNLGNHLGEANALRELGKVRRLRGDYEGATAYVEQALEVHRNLGNRRSEANALRELGIVRRLRGDYEGATAYVEQALEVHRNLGNHLGEAETLNELGQVFAEFGSPAPAMTSFQEALEVARAIASPLEEARALEGIARIQVQVSERKAALSSLREAVGMYRQLGAPEEQAAGEFLAELEADSTPGGAV